MWGARARAPALGRAGLLVVLTRVQAVRRPQLALRVLPYLRDLPQVGRRPVAARRASVSRPPRPGRVFGAGAAAAAAAVRRAGARRRHVGARAGSSGPAIDKTRARLPGRAGAVGAGRLRCRRGLGRCCGRWSDPGSVVVSLRCCASWLSPAGVVWPRPAAQRPGSRPRAPDPRRVPRPWPSCWPWPSPPGRARWRRWTASYAAVAASSPATWAGCWPPSAPASRWAPPSTGWPPRPVCPWCRVSRRASRWPSSAAPRSPTSCTPRPATCARPADAS